MSRKPNSRQFISHPTPAYHRAVEALRALISEKEGTDYATRAYAEAVWEEDYEIFKEWSKSRPCDAPHVCVHRMRRERCPSNRRDPGVCLTHFLPAADHLSEWREEEGNERFIVSQPYSLDYDSMKELVEYCEKLHLRADVSARLSWHFPGETLRIVIRNNASSPQASPTEMIPDVPEEQPLTAHERRPDVLKLYRDGTKLAIQTNAPDERTFVEQFAATLAQTIVPDSKQQQELRLLLNGWLPAFIEISCKLRGYKSAATEQRVLTAGEISPNEASLASLIDDTGSVNVKLLPFVNGHSAGHDD